MFAMRRSKPRRRTVSPFALFAQATSVTEDGGEGESRLGPRKSDLRVIIQDGELQGRAKKEAGREPEKSSSRLSRPSPPDVWRPLSLVIFLLRWRCLIPAERRGHLLLTKRGVQRSSLSSCEKA